MFTKYRQIAAVAELENALVQQGLAQERQYRKDTEAELDQLFQSLQKDMSEDEEVVQKKVLTKLKTDSGTTQILNARLTNPNYKPKEPVTYPLKTNKMAIAIEGAIALVNKKFHGIITGDIPDHRYRTQADETTILGDAGDKETIWGNSKSTFLKTAALYTHLVLNKKNRFSEACFLPGEESWIDRSSMVHVTTLPKDLDPFALTPFFDTYAPYFSDRTTPHGFAYVHSRYTFGGDRARIRPAKNPSLLPHDCSSQVAEWLKSPIAFSTFDLLYYYRITQQETLNEAVRNWQATAPEPAVFKNLVTAVSVRDPQNDIRPGQIYCHSSYNSVDDPLFENTAGTGGHAALIVGLIGKGRDSQILTLSNNRDMPKSEGFGLEAFPLNPQFDAPRGRKVMIFSVNGLEADGKKSAASAAAVDVPSVMQKLRSGLSLS